MATSRSIFTYLSDEHIELNSISKDEFWFSMNMACLFFDEIPFSSAALLGHRFLSSAWASSAGASRLYTSGLIRPVLMGSKHSLTEVASSMIARRTINSLDTGDALLRHAEAIDSAGFKELWVDESEFRLGYSTAFERVVDRFKTDGLRGLDNSELIRPGEISPLHIWAKERVTSEDLRASSVFRFLDAVPGRFSLTATKEVKLLADITYYAVLRTLLDSTLTIDEPHQVHLANMVDSPTGSARQISTSESSVEKVEVSCPLPFDRIARLPVEDVLNLRESTPFRNLRSALHDVRNGSYFPDKRINERLVKCLELLDHYCRKRNTKLRDDMLRDVERMEPLRKIQLSWKPIALTFAATTVGLEAGWMIGGLSALGGLTPLIISELIRRFNFKRYSLPEARKEDVLVDLIDGSRQQKVPGGSGSVS